MFGPIPACQPLPASDAEHQCATTHSVSGRQAFLDELKTLGLGHVEPGVALAIKDLADRQILECCAQKMEAAREKSRNSLVRSSFTIAAGLLRE